MCALSRFVVRVTLLIALCFTAAPAPQASDKTPGPTLAGYHPEVRLRKLHLVRPDLIPYPIAYEVCC